MSHYLANKDIASSNDRLSWRSFHGDLHEPGKPRDDVLHDAEVVETRDDGAEEHDHRKYFERKHVSVRITEHKLGALVGVAHKRLDLLAEVTESRETGLRAQDDDCEQEL